MPTNYSCNVNGLGNAASCFKDKCMGQPDRNAITLLARVKNLAALGGTDYSANLQQLMIDSATWRKRSKDELAAIAVYIALENAIFDGATIDLNVNSLMTAAKCYGAGCIGTEDMHGLLAFLGCLINRQSKPD